MSKELKACPFCGESIEISFNDYDDLDGDRVTGWRPECTSLKCEFFIGTAKVFDTKSEAIKAANTRPSPWITINSDEDLPEANEGGRYSGYVVGTDGESKTWVRYHWVYAEWQKMNSPYDLGMGKIIAYQPIELPERAS